MTSTPSSIDDSLRLLLASMRVRLDRADRVNNETLAIAAGLQAEVDTLRVALAEVEGMLLPLDRTETQRLLLGVVRSALRETGRTRLAEGPL